MYPHIYAPKSLAVDVKLPPPSERPPCPASLHKELLIQMRGVVETLNAPTRAIPTDSEFFVAHGVKGLAAGWQAIRSRLPWPGDCGGILHAHLFPSAISSFGSVALGQSRVKLRASPRSGKIRRAIAEESL
jgi:hypothetical protein